MPETTTTTFTELVGGAGATEAPAAGGRLRINTKLLRAIAACAAAGEYAPRISGVLFRDGEVIATDGHALVRVPIEHDLRLMVPTQLARAACDAQLASDDGQVDEYGYPVTSQNEVVLYADGNDAVVDIGGTTLRAIAGEVDDFPPDAQLYEKASPDGRSVGTLFDPRKLARVNAILDAFENQGVGIELEACGGPLDPMVFKSRGGVEFVLMPMMKVSR